MKKHFRQFSTLILLLISSNLVFAGDASTYKEYGFSEDGKFFAFSETGISDGSGFPYASVTVINVSTNSINKTIQKSNSDESGDVTSVEAVLKLALSEINLSSFGISENKTFGESVVNRPNNDLSNYKNTVFSPVYWPSGGSSSSLPKFELLASSIPISTDNDNKVCVEMKTPSSLLKLSIKGLSNTNLKSKTLQLDSRIPKSRGMCVNSYEVRNVMIYKEKIAVAVRYSSLGFEGPDERFIVVTADLPELK